MHENDDHRVEQPFTADSEPVNPDAAENVEQLSEADGFFADLFSLPTALQRSAVERFLLALLCVFLGILAGILMEGFGGIFLVVMAMFFILSGILIIRDWRYGRIVETMVTCVTVDASVLKKRTRVTFITQEMPHDYFVFNVPGTKDRFHPTVPYLIYVRTRTPDLLLTWMAL